MADADYEAAYNWYVNERMDLAQDFSHAVNQALRRILDGPERWQEIEPGVRRCLTETFPYALVYQLTGDVVHLICVMHLSREPGMWRDRV